MKIISKLERPAKSADKMKSLQELLLEKDANPCLANNDDVGTGMMIVILMKTWTFLLKLVELTVHVHKVGLVLSSICIFILSFVN